MECVVAHCSRALRPAQRRYCTTKREMLAAVSVDASNFGLGVVLSQIQDYVECGVAYYSTTKREMLAAVSMSIQFRSYLRGAKFTL